VAKQIKYKHKINVDQLTTAFSLETKCSQISILILPSNNSTDWTVRGSNSGGGEIFHTCPDRPWGPLSLLYNGYRVFPGGKERPGRDADPSPPSSAVGKERVELYLYSPYGPYDLYRASVPVQGCTLPSNNYMAPEKWDDGFVIPRLRVWYVIQVNWDQNLRQYFVSIQGEKKSSQKVSTVSFLLLKQVEAVAQDFGFRDNRETG
jgi:hypothetical protein